MAKSPQHQFGFQEFGTVHGDLGEVRVDALKDRLMPRVPFPHRHAFYQILFVERGKGWHEIDFRKYPIRGEELFFMRPGQVHSWHVEPGSTGFVVEFGADAISEGEVASDWEALAQSVPEWASLRGARCRTPRERIRTLIAWLAEDRRARPKFLELSTKHQLFALLIAIARASSFTRAPAPLADEYLERFRSLVERHFAEAHEVAFYAERMRLTPKALTMRVARSLGESARAVIRSRVLLEAKRLLAYSNYSVAEVGYELGFEDPSYFTRFFTKLGGETPSAFRAKNRRA